MGREQKPTMWADVGRFVDLSDQYWKTRIAHPGERSQVLTSESIIYEELQTILALQGSQEERHKFLWQTIRGWVVKGSRSLINQLHSKSNLDYFNNVGSIDPEKALAGDASELDETRIGSFKISLSDFGFSNLYIDQEYLDFEGAIENNSPLIGFVYRGLRCGEDPDTVRLCANLGHDLLKIPGMEEQILNLPGTIEYYIKDRGDEKEKVEGYAQLLYIYPLLREGAIRAFEGFEAMALDEYPQAPVDLSKMMHVIEAEAMVRSFIGHGHDRAQSLILNGKEYKVKKDSPIPSFELTTRIDPNLEIVGNAGALHTLFYQPSKNAIQIMFEQKVKDPKMEIVAKACEISGQPLIAVSFTDNGPGFEMAKILRSAQKIYQGRTDITDDQKKIADRWACLELRMVDILNLALERRVSGSGRVSRHSGIGLSLAKQFAEDHGGVIWLTNVPADDGAEILILLDPTKDRSLHKNIPELFSNEKVPVEFLTQIQSQLDNK